MRFGLALPHYDTSLAGEPASWPGVRRIATRAEAAGFDSVWVSDHLFLDWSKYGGSTEPRAALECWTTLSALAAATDTVRIGSLALCNDLRNPALLAKMVATLDLLSGGRLDLGIGAGWYEPEYGAAGIPFDPAGTRIARLGEAVEIVQRLLEGEELVLDGKHYAVDGAICRPLAPQQPRPPVWICGKGDYLLKTAARVADGWNFSWIGSIEAFAERKRAADEACERAAREPYTLRRSVGAYVLAGHDEADVARRYERLLNRTPDGVLRPHKDRAAVSWEEFRTGRIAGTTNEVVEQLGRLSDLGVEEVIFGLGALPFQVADEEDVEFIGAEIIPALR
ncbi:MAG: LLM class flavin-dependent oxidoreductase [Actinomycetota bacterium]|nr:LLM class flavin-dependent oxidoreductase [Actinomycetota bacterium]